jgi:hypothetical protein
MTWDPIVTNNGEDMYDLDSGRPNIGDGTADDYRERVRESIVSGNWNPHGTHRSSFVDTFVTGVDRGHGFETDDKLVGVPLAFNAMLVDLDPYGATSSQLFFDEFSCGIEGGDRIFGRRTGPVVARRLNFGRNTTYVYIAGVASVVWQASFAKGDGLLVEPAGSALLTELGNRVDSGGDILGLTVRFNTYRTAYFGSELPIVADYEALAARILQGGFHPNPARSVVGGVIGLWRRGEAASVPGDRVLLPARRSRLSTAFAKVADDRLTLDLASSVPETGFDLEKLDLGPLTVVARGSTGDVTLGTIATSAYARSAYEATGGIVVLILDRDQSTAARDGDLALLGASGELLTEQPLTVVAHRPNVYLEEGEVAKVGLQVFERGVAPTTPASITVIPDGTPSSHPVVVTDAGGEADLELTGTQLGSQTYWLMPWRTIEPAAPPPPARSPTRMEYVALRVTPAEDDIAALEPTWANVYEQVLRDFEALAPCMDNWLRLGDEQQCGVYAPLIRSLTARERFDDYRYMPVTRELSKGRRTLLHNWCDAVTRPEADLGPAAATAESTAPAEAHAPATEVRTPFGRGF